MSNFMGPMAPPPAALAQPQALDFQTDPNQRQRFKQFMQRRMQPPMQQMPAPMPQPMPTVPAGSYILPDMDIFAPQQFDGGGIVGGLNDLGKMSSQMVEALNQVVYGGDSMGGGFGGGMPSAPSGPPSMGDDGSLSQSYFSFQSTPGFPPPSEDPVANIGSGLNFSLPYFPAQPTPGSPPPSDTPSALYPIGGGGPARIDRDFYSSPEYTAYEGSGPQIGTADMYNSPYFGQMGSGSLGRRQDKAYEDYLMRTGQGDLISTTNYTNPQYLTGNIASGGNIFDIDPIYDYGQDVTDMTNQMTSQAEQFAADSTERSTAMPDVSYTPPTPPSLGDQLKKAGDFFRNIFKFEDGGEVPPRETDIRGQYHELSYITPDEADILMALGGSGEPGPMGIPQYGYGDDDGSGGYGDGDSDTGGMGSGDSDTGSGGGNDGGNDDSGNDSNSDYDSWDGDFEANTNTPKGSEPDDPFAGEEGDEFGSGTYGNDDGSFNASDFVDFTDPTPTQSVSQLEQAVKSGMLTSAATGQPVNTIDPVTGKVSGQVMAGTKEEQKAAKEAYNQLQSGILGGQIESSGATGTSDANKAGLLSTNLDLIDNALTQPLDLQDIQAIDELAFGPPAQSVSFNDPQFGQITQTTDFDLMGRPTSKTTTSDLADFRKTESYSYGPTNAIDNTAATSNANKAGLLDTNLDLVDDIFTTDPMSSAALDKTAAAATGLTGKNLDAVIGYDKYGAPVMSGAAYGKNVDLTDQERALGNFMAQTVSGQNRPDRNMLQDIETQMSSAIDRQTLDQSGALDKLGIFADVLPGVGVFKGVDEVLALAEDARKAAAAERLTDIVERGHYGVVDAETGQLVGTVNPTGGIFGTGTYSGRPGYDPFASGATLDPETNSYTVTNGSGYDQSGGGDSSVSSGGGAPEAPKEPVFDPLFEVQPPLPVDPGPVLVDSNRQPVPANLQGPVGYGMAQAGQINPYALSEMQRYQQMLARLNQPKSPIDLADGGSVLDAAAGRFLESLTAA